MKVLSFLRCGVVIALSLIAGRAGAQIDSNSTVTLWIATVGDDCTMEVSVTGDSDGIPVFTWYNQTYGEWVNYLGKFRLADHSPGQKVITVDTTKHLIIGVSIYYSHSGFQSGSLEVDFDPIPYVDSVSILVAKGAFEASYQLSEVYNEPHVGGKSIFGSCSKVGTFEDSVAIEIQLPEDAVIVSSIANDNHSSIAEIFQDGDYENVSIQAWSSVRNLEVMNMLGVHLADILIHPGASSVDIPITQFPPGLYFARLGDQVAKFVVPPR